MRQNGERGTAVPIDEALLRRAKAGDRDALSVLYETTNLEIYRTIHAMVNDEDLVLDIQQDAYLQAFSHLDQLREAESFLPWLRRIAVNEARAQLRRKRPLLFSELSDDAEKEAPALPDLRPEGSPELALDRKENARLVSEILNGLSDGQRLLVGMYYYEQIPVREIAEDLGVSSGTVKTQLYRSRKKIEAAVRRLEEKDVKLYGLSPLPFLLALLKKQEPAAEAGKAVLEGSLSRAGIVSETAAVHVGRSFFQTALGRVVLGVIAAGVVGGGILGYQWAREQLRIGDYQPPTETLEFHQHVESDEDLSTEPSTENLRIETPEDLTAEPVTTESETTEPKSTEPEATEPETRPGKAEAPSDTPGGHVPQPPEAPTQQTEEPSVPEALDPTGNPPDPISQPTEPTATEEIVLSPRIVSCSWGESDELYDQPWGSQRCLTIVTEDGASPTVYTDNENVVALRGEGYWNSDTDARQRIYRWEVTFLGPGTAQVFCAYNNEVAHVFSVTNPAYPDEILKIEVNQLNDPEQIQMKRDQIAWCTVFVQGRLIPELTTDNPEVLQLGNREILHDGNDNWIKTLYGWPLQPQAAGTARVTVSFDGRTIRTITVIVAE